MGAFIVAGIVVVCGFGVAALQLFAAGMSDATDQGDDGAAATAISTVVIAGLIVATHWLPAIGW